MSATAAALVKAAILALTDENTRKKIGWVLAAILSPVILLIAFLCALGSGTASHNLSVVELCFYGGKVPSETPDEYRAYIEEMRAGFNLLDGSIENINELTEGEDGLDEIRVKALFYALYFGTDSPSQQDCQKFVSCFVTWGLDPQNAVSHLELITREKEAARGTAEPEETRHVLPESELPMNASGMETLDNVCGLFETAIQLESRDHREALFRLASKLMETQNLLDWIEKTPEEQELPELAES